jgi:hypothetical protein
MPPRKTIKIIPVPPACTARRGLKAHHWVCLACEKEWPVDQKPPCTMADQHHLMRRINEINVFAEHEGWAIFNGNEIQRDDIQNVFSGDDAAIRHVNRLAAHGSTLHRMALEICADAQKEAE